MRKFYKVSYSDAGILPTRADSGSAGYDFYATEDTAIAPKEVKLIKTDIKAEMEKDEVLLLIVRSSIGIKRHLTLPNGTGVIDSTYYNNPDNEGNILVAMYNYSDSVQEIKKGERIAQGIFVKYLTTDDDNPLSDKRTGGIGSSGR